MQTSSEQGYIIGSGSNIFMTNTNNTTITNDYLSNWIHSSMTGGTGTTYNPYDQTCTIPYQTLFIGTYYDQRNQEYRPQEPCTPVEKSLEQIKEESEATERAKNLLLEYLDDDNKQKFLNKKHLEIVSKIFKDVKYHIPLSKLGGIKTWKNNSVITELCISVKEVEQLPTEDVILTKLLHVTNDEANMLKIANHSNVKENLLLGLN